GVSAQRLTDIDPGPGSNPFIGPEELTVFANALYFRAYQPQTGMELWKFAGVSARRAADIAPGPGFSPYYSSRPQGLTVFGQKLFFSADDGVKGREVWTYDGVKATRLTDLIPGAVDAEPFTGTFDFTDFGGALYFIANPGDNVNRLFRY